MVFVFSFFIEYTYIYIYVVFGFGLPKTPQFVGKFGSPSLGSSGSSGISRLAVHSVGAAQEKQTKSGWWANRFWSLFS